MDMIEEKLAAEAIIKIGKLFWFVPLRENALYTYDRESGEITYITRFAKEKRNTLLYSQIIFYKQKLFFVPNLAEWIAIYSINDGTMHYIDYLRDYVMLSQGCRFRTACIVGECLYMIPSVFREVVQIDLETERISFYDIAMPNIDKLVGSRMGYVYCWNNVAVVRQCIYIPLITDGGIIEFNTVDKSIKRMNPLNTKEGFTNLFAQNDIIWLIPKAAESIYAWNLEKGKIEKIFSFPKGFIPSKDFYNFNEGIIIGDCIYLLQIDANMSICINTKEQRVNVLELPEYKLEEENKRFWYERYRFCRVMVDDGVIVISGIDGKWYNIVNDTAKCMDRKFLYDENSMVHALEDKFEDSIDGIVLEQSGDLERYLKYVCVKTEDDLRHTTEIGVGEIIHTCMKND